MSVWTCDPKRSLKLSCCNPAKLNMKTNFALLRFIAITPPKTNLALLIKSTWFLHQAKFRNALIIWRKKHKWATDPLGLYVVYVNMYEDKKKKVKPCRGQTKEVSPTTCFSLYLFPSSVAGPDFKEHISCPSLYWRGFPQLQAAQGLSARESSFGMLKEHLHRPSVSWSCPPLTITGDK